MRLLLVKTSSLGDVIHNLPVVSDIHRHFPEAVIDWCVEDSFAAIPRLHSAVEEVIPVAIRRWRKHPFARQTWQDFSIFRAQIKRETYDLVIDTQGLLKSALVAAQARGTLCGYSAASAREPLAARFYDRCLDVEVGLHAVERNRLLAGAALGYRPEGDPDYGIVAPTYRLDGAPSGPYAVFLTATSRDDKLWPEAHWIALGHRLHAQGIAALLPAGSPVERERALRLAAAIPDAVAVPPLRIGELAGLLGGARLAVGVDTGLSHLAVALRVPTVALYVATDPGLTGVLGSGFHRNLGGKGLMPLPDEVISALAPVL